jgi:hypothetical protein
MKPFLALLFLSFFFFPFFKLTLNIVHVYGVLRDVLLHAVMYFLQQSRSLRLNLNLK